MELIQKIFSNPIYRLIYRPLGLNKNSAPALWFTLLGLALVYALLILSGGNIKMAGLVLIPYVLILVTIYKIEYSFYLLLFCVLFFDQFGIPGFDPFTYTTDYFRNLKEISYLPYIPGGVINPIEIHFILLMGVWFFSLPFRKQKPFKSIPVWPAFIFFLGTFLFSFVYGIKSGDFLVALWEVRALFYFSFLYLFIPQIITTRKQVKAIIWISIIAISLKALQAIHRYIMVGFTTGGFQTLTNHEDPVFMTTIFILMAGLFLFGSKDKQKWVLLVLAVPIGLGFYLGMRRAAYAGCMVSFASFLVILPTSYQIKILKKSVPYVLLFIIYVGFALFNSRSPISAPVNMVKSGLAETTLEENPQDYYSNLYRDYENYNLAITIQRNPFIGIGFGNKYDMPLNLASISFPLRDYIPHNEIFWYLIKTGGMGFMMFWVFFNSVAFKGTQVMYRLKDPYFKAVSAMVVLAIINQMVVSYFDLQLTYYRNMIYLGVLTGLLPALISIAEDEEEEKVNTHPHQNFDKNHTKEKL